MEEQPEGKCMETAGEAVRRSGGWVGGWKGVVVKKKEFGKKGGKRKWRKRKGMESRKA